MKMLQIKKTWPLLAIILIAAIVYWPVTGGEYLAGWDDDQQILNNEDVKNLSWESVKNYFTTYYVASYQPLASFSFGVEYALFGENATVHHVTNLMLHLFNVVLVFLLLSRLFKARPFVIWLVTAVFAFHPLQTEAIGWISTRSTLLFVAFFISSCLAYIRYINSEKKLKYLAFCGLWFVLALFTKSAAVTLPLVLLLLDYYYQRKFTWAVLLQKVPFLLGSVVIGLVSVDSRRVVNSLEQFSDYYTFFEKTGLSAYTLVMYFWKSIAPLELMTYYGYPMKLEEGEALGFEYLLAPLALLVLLLLIWWVYRKSAGDYKRQWLFGVLFFAVNIGLYVNFTPFGPTMWAERYMYLPLIGVFICFGLLLEHLYKIDAVKNGVIVVTIALLLFFAYQSRVQSYVWHDRVSLWENSIEFTNAVYPWMELGNEYQKQGNIDKAIEYYNGGVALNPFYPKVYYYRGLAIKEKGDKAYARKDFTRVIESGNDKKGDAFYERGLLFEEANMLDSAMADYDSALVYNPQGMALFRKNSLSGGEQGAGNQTVLLQRISTMLIKGDSLMKAGSLDQALTSFDNVLLINPASEGALMSKGLIQSAQSQFAEAAITFSALLAQYPENQRARLSRAFAYSQTREFDKSIQDYDYVTETLGARTGEILYFKGIALLNASRKEAGCSALAEAEEKGHEGATRLRGQACM